ncbi:hypothetical protein ACIQ6R_13315 [Streptomyces sp. NPDC096048]|uniref:hypothetical protein n=1 Tax=Streptomyces sp. NPDC096048 TaxID=3366072 RepID=UPI0038292578
MRLWAESFDTQSAAGWDVTNGTVTFDTTTPRQGAASLSCTTATAVQASITKQIYPTDTPTARVHLRAWVRVNAAPSATTAIMAWSFNATTVSGFYCIKLQPNLALIPTLSGGTTGTASAPLTLGQWHYVEMYYDDTAGIIKARLDGVLWATRTSSVLGGGRYARFGIINPAIADIDFDDVVVDDRTLGPARARDSAGPLAGRIATPTGELVDDFDDGIVDPVLWPDSYGGVTEAGGRAQVPCGLDYAAYASAKVYTLRNSQLACRMYPAPVGDSLVACWSQVLIQTTTPGTDVVIEHNAIADTLGMALRVGYADPEYTAIPYDPVAHAYLRIRQTGADLLWETSPDDATWTTRRTVAAPAWVSDPNLQVQLIAHRDDGTPEIAEFDDVNMAPAAVVVPLGTASEETGATPYGASKARALTNATDTQAAVPLTGAKARTLADARTTDQARGLTVARRSELGAATEQSSAGPVGHARTAVVGQALEVTAAGTVGYASALVLGTAWEHATAAPATVAKTGPAGAASTSDRALALTAAKRAVLGTAGTAEEARPFTTAGETRLEDARATERGLPVTGSKTAPWLLAAAGDTALPVTAAKHQPTSAATSADSAAPLAAGRRVPLVEAHDRERTGRLTAGKQLTLGTATDGSRARMLHLRSSGDLGAAWAMENAGRLRTAKQLLLGTARTAETGGGLAADREVPLGAASATDWAAEVTRGKEHRLGVARCTDRATAATSGKHHTLGAASAAERAGTIRQPFQTRRLRPARAHDTAAPIEGRKQQPADTLTPSVTGPTLTPSTSGPQLAASVSGPSLTPSTSGGG